MLTLSKALSATQARTYHAREFTSEKQNYWSRDRKDTVNGKESLRVNGVYTAQSLMSILLD
jgi:hypothetical protein